MEFHKHHIRESFSLKSNADLVLFALKHGLISADIEPYTRVKVCPRPGLRISVSRSSGSLLRIRSTYS